MVTIVYALFIKFYNLMVVYADLKYFVSMVNSKHNFERYSPLNILTWKK